MRRQNFCWPGLRHGRTGGTRSVSSGRATHQRLALLDTGYEAAVAGEPQKRAVLVNQAQEQGIDAIAATWALPMLAPAHRHQPQLVQEMLQMVGRMSPQIYAGQTRALLGRPDATPVLATITCPTLILCGATMAGSPPERHARMAELVKGSNLLVIPACGHMSTMEQSDAVSQACWTGPPEITSAACAASAPSRCELHSSTPPRPVPESFLRAA